MTCCPRDGSILEPLTLARLSVGAAGMLESAVDYIAEAMISARGVQVRRMIRRGVWCGTTRRTPDPELRSQTGDPPDRARQVKEPKNAALKLCVDHVAHVVEKIQDCCCVRVMC